MFNAVYINTDVLSRLHADVFLCNPFPTSFDYDIFMSSFPTDIHVSLMFGVATPTCFNIVYFNIRNYICMNLIIHEMLRKTRQGNTTQLAQNTHFSKEKLGASVGTQIRFRGNALTIMQ